MHSCVITFLRKINTAVNAGKFKPTPHVPSLQCIGYVENGGAADLAGLKQGDFIIEVSKEKMKKKSDSARDRTGDLECVRLT